MVFRRGLKSHSKEAELQGRTCVCALRQGRTLGPPTEFVAFQCENGITNLKPQQPLAKVP
jgi:hypothetical protein